MVQGKEHLTTTGVEMNFSNNGQNAKNTSLSDIPEQIKKCF